MCKRNNNLLLKDIIEDINNIEDNLEGYTEDYFYRDRKLKMQ